MPTNEERRKLAARLRNIIGYTSLDILETIQEACGCNAGLAWEDVMELKNRLADLIEPEPKRTTRLELVATEVDKNGDALAVGIHCAVCGFLDEDAIGVDPDNWMLWKYCPSCGAKVIER